VADAFVDAGLMPRQLADHKLGWITKRLGEQEGKIRQSLAQASLLDRPVLTSAHQEAFCHWLGLKVIATFSGSDTAGIGQLDRAVRDGEQAGVKVIIANLPEGRQVADALGERLGAKVVVFGNFPALNAGQGSFDDLLTANVAALAEAVAK
jgi:ABC-type Zn uptake system ZnuABC Zn-binding protein ZnuA